jgi:integrase
LRTIIAGLDPDRTLDVLDRALILLGFAGAFRRSELVGLNVEDLEFNENGLVVHLRRSKTDPEGQGRKVGIPYGLAPATCPVRAVEAEVQVLQIVEGPLFRAVDRHGHIYPTRLTPQSVALVVKRLIAKAGIPGDVRKLRFIFRMTWRAHSGRQAVTCRGGPWNRSRFMATGEVL